MTRTTGGSVAAKKRKRRASAKSRQTRQTRQVQIIPKEPLAREIQRLVAERGLSQAAAAVIVQDAASQLSLLLSGKLRGFSIDRLVRTLLRLGREVEVVVRPAKRLRQRGQATVTVVRTAAKRRR